MQYTNAQTGDLIEYKIVKQPYFETSTITIDAGRLVAAKNLSSLKEKDAGIPAIWSFSQEQIDTWEIAYMPPVEDIGPIRRTAQLLFSVCDINQNCFFDQQLEITILPVNNQVPFVTKLNYIRVKEGETVVITDEHFTAHDSDTDQSQLLFRLKVEPKFGQIIKEDYRMVEGEEFSVKDLARKIIRYCKGVFSLV